MLTSTDLPHLEELIHAWRESPFPSTKISNYFPVYVELFARLRGNNCTFIETGVLGGGSLFMWRKWLGSQARIIGIDLNPAAKRWEQEGFEIIIGDQGDPAFWDEIFPKIGAFDVLLDDGGHQSFQQIVTLTSAIRHASSEALVVVEDTHSSFLKDFSAHGDCSFLNYAKDSTDVLTARARSMYPNRFTGGVNVEIHSQFSKIYGIKFFGSIVAFEVQESLAVEPEVLWNKPQDPVADFRYRGVDHAVVAWPDPFSVKNVLVKGRGES